MRNELNLWVAGGDMRQAKLAELLAADGHTVHAYALERLGALDGVEMEESLEGAALADCVVLPLPAVGEGSLLNAPLSGRKHPLALVLDALRPGQVICAGMVGPRRRRWRRTGDSHSTTTLPGRSWRWPMRCPPPCR